jgi:hypothetical protein
MRPKARESRLLRRAAQVQARNQQLAAENGRNDVVLLLTHAARVSGPRREGQPKAPRGAVLMPGA